MKKKVLYVITKSNWGGAQRYVFNLATALPRDEFEVAVAFGGTGVAHSSTGELASRLALENIPTSYIRTFVRDVALLNDLHAVRELYLLFKKEKPDIVHLNSSKAGGVGALAARMAGVKKIIFTSHGLAWDEDRGQVATFLMYFFSRITFLLCHQVIVISKDNLERTQPYSSNKFVLIHNGLPTLQFDARERSRVALALRVGLVEDGNTFWIGTVAELTRNKGLPYLLDAAKLLHKEGRIFHLFILGNGEEEHALKKQIIENALEEVVHLAGFVPDAYRYDLAFDVFTLTSTKEGLPTVLLEAGQAGRAVVASDIPGTLDIIDDTKTGLLSRSKDPSDIARNIAQLMDDALLRETLGHTLQEKVAREFSIETMVNKTKEVYAA